MHKPTPYRRGAPIGRIFTYLLLLAAAAYTLVPFGVILITSLRETRDAVRGPFTWPRQWDAVSNYSQAWDMGNFERYLLNSVYMTVLTVAITLAVATLAGYSFAKFRYPGRGGLYYLLLFSMMIPFQTIMLPLYFVLRALGMLNSLTGIGILLSATGLGFAVMMMRSFFVSLPDSMLEAARLDGAGEIQVLLRVVMPNTYPAWSSLVIFVALGSWNNLLAPMLYIFSENKYPIPFALYAFSDAQKIQYGLLAAAMMISVLPIMVVYLIFAKNFQTSLLAGSVKG